MPSYDPDPKIGDLRKVPTAIRPYKGLVSAWLKKTGKLPKRRSYKRKSYDPEFEPKRRRRLGIGKRGMGLWFVGFLAGLGIPIWQNWKTVKPSFESILKGQAKAEFKLEDYWNNLKGNFLFWIGVILCLLRFVPLKGIVPRKAMLGQIGTGLAVGSAIGSAVTTMSGITPAVAPPAKVPAPITPTPRPAPITIKKAVTRPKAIRGYHTTYAEAMTPIPIA